MVEVTNNNFNNILNDFKNDIKKCAFFAIDCEFTEMPEHNGFFETPEARYIEVKKSIGKCLIHQVGITPFMGDTYGFYYRAVTYNFYVFPRAFGDFKPSIVLDGPIIEFFCKHKYDFNKVFHGGIPYMNKTNIDKLSKKLKNGTLLSHVEENLDYTDINDLLQICDKIKKWISVSDGKTYELPYKKFSPAFNYVLKEEVCRLSKTIWCISENNKIIVTKVNPEERSQLEKNEQTAEAREIFLESLMGFSKVFDILSSSKKPLVGHNCLIDIFALYHHFHEDLPASYSKFKENIHSLFPCIYDTKYIVYRLRYLQRKVINGAVTALRNLYKGYQNEGTIFYFPNVYMDPEGIYANVKLHAHDAGWDSYMTGFIFLKMADEFTNLRRRENHPTPVTLFELLIAMDEMKNKINLPRGATYFMSTCGDDPASSRPPILYVGHYKKQSLGKIELNPAFNKYELINIKKFNSFSVLIATPNFKSCRTVFQDFLNSEEFIVAIYSPLRHHRGLQLSLADVTWQLKRKKGWARKWMASRKTHGAFSTIFREFTTVDHIKT